MQKFSEVLINILDEMEFLVRVLSSAQIYYSSIDDSSEAMIKNAKLHITNAVIDLATDLEHKINRRSDRNNDFTKQIEKNLEDASRILKDLPGEHKIKSFSDIELSIADYIGFIKDYSVYAGDMVEDFNMEEKRTLNSKIINIKARRTV
ncbi:MAG: hypothetical protein K0R25_1389 [Rickettsiaceae bacterium]|jgi:glutamine synthetase type III|nr:hypothetical protein [Rickettsiaceae bacterium]